MVILLLVLGAIVFAIARIVRRGRAEALRARHAVPVGAAPHEASRASRQQRRPPGDGERTLRISLLTLFLALPAALLVAMLWFGLVGTSNVENPADVVTGWRGVLYDLPALLLVLGAAATSLAFAAKALRARAQGATLGLWLSTAGLTIALAVTGTTMADTIVTPHSATINWAVRVIAVLVAAEAMFLARDQAHAT